MSIRLTPRARRDGLDGVVNAALKVSVSAPPLDNRANDALLQLLARLWRLPRSSLSLAAGTKSRDKVVHIAGDPAALAARLGPLLVATSAADDGQK